MATNCKIYALISPDEPDNYRYVGQTIQSLKSRFNGHMHDAINNKKNYPVQCWIRKLLKNNIKPLIILIEENCTWNESEKFYIKKFKEEGHNLLNYTDGGNAFSGLSGKKNSFYGKKHSKDARKKMSEHAKNRTGEKNPNYGNKWTKKQKDIMSQKNSKKVKCITDGKIFPSLTKCAEYYSISITSVYRGNKYGTMTKGLLFEYLGGE